MGGLAVVTLAVILHDELPIAVLDDFLLEGNLGVLQVRRSVGTHSGLTRADGNLIAGYGRWVAMVASALADLPHTDQLKSGPTYIIA